MLILLQKQQGPLSFVDAVLSCGEWVGEVTHSFLSLGILGNHSTTKACAKELQTVYPKRCVYTCLRNEFHLQTGSILSRKY